jgi:adenine specific DNA methylase Mod
VGMVGWPGSSTVNRPPLKTNALYYGDNLDILGRYMPDESVDLVYLDPPFNSNRDYNVIFKDESGRKSDAQLLAFEDTWHWGPDAEQSYRYLTNSGVHGGRVSSQAANAHVNDGLAIAEPLRSLALTSLAAF